jgi:hypothetical protein
VEQTRKPVLENGARCEFKQNLVHQRNRIALAAVKNKKTRHFPPNAEAKDDSG